MPAQQPREFIWRAIGAFALMIGFYGLAVVIIGLLWYNLYAQVRNTNRFSGRYVFFCLFATALIISGMIPRRDKFVTPGDLITEDEQPRLFRELKAIAVAVGQDMPAEVYLIPEFNAWVSQRGGRASWGGKKVMGLGLPLLNMLTVSQLRAVLAHEFGHFHGGDTRLGPVIYRTRDAISRTVEGLGKGRSILQMPFVLYGKMCLRITYGVSRQQEYAADNLAAAVAGSTPLAGGLETIHRLGPAYAVYWQNEFMPLLASGYYAPLLEGFSRFTEDPKVEALSDKALEEAKKSKFARAYDTHPSLGERIEAIHSLAQPAERKDSGSASLLIDRLAAEEKIAVEIHLRRYATRRLTDIAWDEVATKVYVRQWDSLIRERGSWLEGITPASLPDVLKDLSPLAASYQHVIGRMPSSESFQSVVTMSIGASLALKLTKRGWTLNDRPAFELKMRKGEKEVAPFGILPRLGTGDLSAEDWRSQCREYGISDGDLGTPD